jgi:hypothetical protein
MLRKSRLTIPIVFTWIGAFFFWGFTFGEGHFHEQLIAKYKMRNVIAGATVLIIAVFTIFYSAYK